jgi:hypothetical protein
MLPEQLSLASVPHTGAQVAILLLSLFLAASQLFQVLLGERKWTARLDRLGAHAALLLACSLLLETLDRATMSSDQAIPWLEAAIAFTVAGAVIALHRIVASGRMIGLHFSSRAARGMLLAVCAVAAGWSGQQVCEFCDRILTQDGLGLFYTTPGKLAEVVEQAAVTDTGRRIPLFRWEVSDGDFRRFRQHEGTRLSMFGKAAIPRSPSDRHSNCHGWVFSNSRFLLQGRDIEWILSDNGYTPTRSPDPEDVVVYRDRDGVIVHTGVVRGVLDDGTIMIESKFGLDGVFLHEPQSQPYATDYVFYHTDRPGHAITIEDRTEHDVAKRNGSEASGLHSSAGESRVNRRGAGMVADLPI